MSETAVQKLPKIFGPHVLIKPKEIEKYRGRIQIVRQDEERLQGAMTEGTVVALGPQAFKDELNPNGVDWYAVGDRVIYKKYAGTNIKLNDTEYVLMKYEDVIALLEDGDTFSKVEVDSANL